MAVLLEPLDGVITGVVIGEHLREEQAQGDPGGVDPVAPPMMAATAGRLDGGAREEFEER